MTQEPVRNAAPSPAAGGLPMPQLTPDAQRGLSIAILRARPDCCNVCRALMPLQEALFRELESSPPPPGEPTFPEAPTGASFPDWATPPAPVAH